jgi:hypothetical protein
VLPANKHRQPPLFASSPPVEAQAQAQAQAWAVPFLLVLATYHRHYCCFSRPIYPILYYYCINCGSICMCMDIFGGVLQLQAQASSIYAQNTIFAPAATL